MTVNAATMLFLWLFSLPINKIEKFSPICEDLVVNEYIGRIPVNEFLQQNHRLILMEIEAAYDVEHWEVYSEFVDNLSFFKWLQEQEDCDFCIKDDSDYDEFEEIGPFQEFVL